MTFNETPPPGFVLAFLLFSGLFLANTYRLWFRTDAYYEDIRASLQHSPSLYPFREFFLRRTGNRRRWEVEQKVISAIGFVAVIGADVLVLMAFFK